MLWSLLAVMDIVYLLFF
ncbi:DUF2770 family protein [Salmonella enterica subsp. enterica serovar Kentucky]